ncbi:hypothetical protein COX11_01430 [Candidatus Berkelbacteria bacterium CG23_combo_of_CG06-09_8_20_14_all_41_73]|uniref:Uncharacterized protein n=1 Tax=Candidatus Berkelbacteria bacterium CG23_combo_of_CG06-09_8_20_14_all_41_73 TaxID=1974519 RepID=A0A2H0B1Z3_9BACT|nr:MAG: hypothetical protein COX11_01430 [Candidatus Berkelbacteria bacterium CG23_combo_of_CG06-09_8_20_14_all_41_73]
MEINEEKLKGILKEHQKHTDVKFDELKRYFDVVREDFDGKVKLIAEQYDSIIEKLDSHEARLVSIEKNIEIMKVDISFIKNGLKKKVDVEEFEALEKRVAILEAK